MKTISDLTAKWWYRLVKVIFILSVIFVLVAANAFYMADVGIRKLDAEKTKVVCNVKDRNSYSLSELDLYMSPSYFQKGIFSYKDYFEGYNEPQIKKILSKCLDTEITYDVMVYQKFGEIANANGFKKGTELTDEQQEIINKIEKEIFTSEKAKYLDYSFRTFDVVPKITYWKGIAGLLLLNVGILLLTELIRRIFYYIVLGNIRPRKDESDNLS